MDGTYKEEINLIAILQEIQEEHGFLPEEECSKTANRLGIPLARLWGIATFYSQFKLKPNGEHLIQVCNGTACHVNNSKEIIEAIKEELNINEDETTKDNMFTLEIVNCIGACARAPAIMIDGKVYGNLNSQDIPKLLDKYKD